MSILIISCSLNPDSQSYRLALAAKAALRAPGAASAPDTDAGEAPVHLVDLRRTPLPLCNGTAAQRAADSATRDHDDVAALAAAIVRAPAVILAVPVYNFNTSAAAKNLIELTGAAWQHKIVGFLCAAGGGSAYMAPLSLAHSLMLDFRCLIVPRFVYATRGDFDDDGAISAGVRRRVDNLCRATTRLADALAASDWAGDAEG